MNVYRGLIYNGEVSLTIADTTEIVNEGIRLHKLTPSKGYLLGKALSALTFFSACLKEEKGEISLSIQQDGKEIIGASGNRALSLRGYIAEGELYCQNEDEERIFFSSGGSFTLVRDDGYNRPFVGSCALLEGSTIDEGVEEYYRVSEQLPTRIKTIAKLNEGSRCAFAGVIALQPLPFASEETLEKVARFDLAALLKDVEERGMEEGAQARFEGEIEKRRAAYRCNCSRDYLSAVLVTLGEAQLREVIHAEGEVRVHCHYCNTDYVFTGEDVDRLFSK